jgi:NDP-sugar pyrophosphorylase family protein
MDAVVMAAGEGRRLRPVTERFAKPVLPIDGRPVVVAIVQELVAAGFGQATVVVGHLAEQVERLLGDGSAFGIELRYVHQPAPDGSADAVRRALEAGAQPPLVVTAADTLYTRDDVGGFVRAWEAAGTTGALAVRRDPPPSPPHRAAVRIENGLIRTVQDGDPANPFAAAPLWLFGPEVVSYLERVPGPPYENAAALQLAVDSGLAVSGVEIGKTRDLTYPLDLVKENFPYLSAL